MALLDCCREFRYNDQLELTRGGLNNGVSNASISNTMVAYSCGPNEQAFDGKGDHGRLVTRLLCGLLPSELALLNSLHSAVIISYCDAFLRHTPRTFLRHSVSTSYDAGATHTNVLESCEGCSSLLA